MGFIIPISLRRQLRPREGSARRSVAELTPRNSSEHREVAEPGPRRGAPKWVLHPAPLPSLVSAWAPHCALCPFHSDKGWACDLLWAHQGSAWGVSKRNWERDVLLPSGHGAFEGATLDILGSGGTAHARSTSPCSGREGNTRSTTETVSGRHKGGRALTPRPRGCVRSPSERMQVPRVAGLSVQAGPVYHESL